MTSGWSSLQIRTIALCFVINMLDGADVLVVSFVAPLLTADWQVSTAAFGVVFSAGLVGMTIGALGIAPYADVVGRRPMILLATVVIAAGMLLSALADSVTELVALRVFTGLGIGAMLASVTALASEYAPPRFRSFAVTFVTAGYPAGATLAGLIGGWIIPDVGWSGLFVAVGLGSALLFPVLLFALPESAEFRAARERTREQRRRPPIGSLLKGPSRFATVLMWGAFFSSFFTVYFLTSWIPRIAVDAGYPLATAIRGSSAFNVGALIGLLLLGIFASRLDLAKLIVAFFIGAFGAMMAVAFFHKPVTVFYLGMVAMGVLVQGGFGGLYAIAGQLYPPESKSTGVGWSIGIGRLGAVAGPAVGGLVLSSGLGLVASFAVFALPMLMAASFTWLIARSSPARGVR